MRKVQKKVHRIVRAHARHHRKISYVLLAVSISIFLVSLFIELHPSFRELSIIMTAERLAALGSASV